MIGRAAKIHGLADMTIPLSVRHGRPSRSPPSRSCRRRCAASVTSGTLDWFFTIIATVSFLVQPEAS